MPKGDPVKAYMVIKDLKDQEFLDNNYLVFCTKRGLIKKTKVEAFSRVRSNGINAITINEGDQLLEVRLTNGQNEILIANRNGRAIRFPEGKVRPMGRAAAGVRGISLDDDGEDAVIGMVAVDPNDPDTSILVVSEKGNGKRSALEDYRITNRGGKGVRTLLLTEKTGKLVAIKTIRDGDDLMITNKSGIVIRMTADPESLRIMGRATQGVRLIKLEEGDEIADVAVVFYEEAEETDAAETPEGNGGANEAENPDNQDIPGEAQANEEE